VLAGEFLLEPNPAIRLVEANLRHSAQDTDPPSEAQLHVHVGLVTTKCMAVHRRAKNNPASFPIVLIPLTWTDPLATVRLALRYAEASSIACLCVDLKLH
jgi:hypothetical protein